MSVEYQDFTNDVMYVVNNKPTVIRAYNRHKRPGVNDTFIYYFLFGGSAKNTNDLPIYSQIFCTKEI